MENPLARSPRFPQLGGKAGYSPPGSRRTGRLPVAGTRWSGPGRGAGAASEVPAGHPRQAGQGARRPERPQPGKDSEGGRERCTFCTSQSDRDPRSQLGDALWEGFPGNLDGVWNVHGAASL